MSRAIPLLLPLYAFMLWTGTPLPSPLKSSQYKITQKFDKGLISFNPLAYTDVSETARLARSINTQPAVKGNSETNPTSQHNRGIY